MLVCISYAVCMHSRMHTFTPSQPYGHAYSRFCMHCMQSIPELCSHIACIVDFFDAYNAYNLSELFTSATVFGHIAKPMRIINGQVFVPGMPGVRRRVKKCVKDLEENPRTQDVLPRMDFTPRQARCLLRDFYFGRYGKWNADYMDLARLTSIARSKVDPIARWSTIPACVPVCDERFIWDWRIPARWYRRHAAYNPSDR